MELKDNGDGKVVASSICRHETGDAAVMNSAVVSEGRSHFLIAGMDDKSVIYSFLIKMVTPKEGGAASMFTHLTSHLSYKAIVVINHGFIIQQLLYSKMVLIFLELSVLTVL